MRSTRLGMVRNAGLKTEKTIPSTMITRSSVVSVFTENLGIDGLGNLAAVNGTRPVFADDPSILHVQYPVRIVVDLGHLVGNHQDSYARPRQIENGVVDGLFVAHVDANRRAVE